MTIEQEAKEIIKNAQEAYRCGWITTEQMNDVVRLAMKDMLLARAFPQKGK